MISAQRPLTGRKVLIMTCSAFAVIIGVNLTLAFKAVSTFPGLETKNSYVTSQAFDADRASQVALGWDVAAQVTNGVLSLTFMTSTGPIAPEILSATFGRATHVGQDQMPNFTFDGRSFVAPVDAPGGNWNLRVQAQAKDGTQFRQRVIVRVTR